MTHEITLEDHDIRSAIRDYVAKYAPSDKHVAHVTILSTREQGNPRDPARVVYAKVEFKIPATFQGKD